MKKFLGILLMVMISLTVGANEVESISVINCLQKAMYISDLQAARVDLQKKAQKCEDNSAAALTIYKQIMQIDIRIAELTYELRKAVYSVPAEDKDSNEMEFVRAIMDDTEK